MANYEFELKEDENMFFVNLTGFFTENTVEEYMDDLEKEVNQLSNKNNLNLVINANDHKVVKKELKEKLAECFFMYQDFGFKDAYIIKPDSAIPTQQIKTGIEQNDLDIKLVDSIEDIN